MKEMHVFWLMSVYQTVLSFEWYLKEYGKKEFNRKKVLWQAWHSTACFLYIISVFSLFKIAILVLQYGRGNPT